MKKLVAILLAVCSMFCLFSMTGCAEEKGTVEVKISGSSSVTPLMEKLAAAFEAKKVTISETSGDTTVEKVIKIKITSTDSSSGIKAAQDGTSEIGMASRELKESETGVTSQMLCYDGIAVIANKSSELTGVTRQQLCDLYYKGTAIGSATNGISREDGSGTRSAFDELVFKGVVEDWEKTPFSDAISVSNQTGAVKAAVVSDASKIGYISLGAVDDTIKTLTYEGVIASVENILNATYELSRPFNVVFKEGVQLSEAAQKFMAFIESEEGQKVISDEGYVPLEA